MAVAQRSAMVMATHRGHPAWTGFVATAVNQIKSFYRQPGALVFTLGQPLALLVILDTFHFHITLDNGQTVPYLDFLMPGLIAFQGMVIGLNSVAFQLARDKHRGTLRRIRATPIPTLSFVGGVIVSRLVIATAATLITYVTGVYVFGANLQGNAALMILLGVLGAAVFIAIGILIVSIARSDEDVPPLTFLPLMVSVLFSGAFLDRSGLPDWLHFVTGLLPLTYVTNAVQDVANFGAGLSGITGDLLGLMVWGVGITLLAAWRFRMA